MDKVALITILSVLIGCGTPNKTVTQNKEMKNITTNNVAEGPTVQKGGLDPQDMDLAMDPGQDFYQYSNGGWLKRTEIPADRGRWGSFDALRKHTSDNVMNMMNEASIDNFEKNSDQWKAFAFFDMGMDTAYANALGIMPINNLLQAVDKIDDPASLQGFIEKTQEIGLGAFYSFGVGPDARKSSEYAMYLGGGKLGLPDRDYYVKDDEESIRLKTAYQNHIARMLPYIGYSQEEAKKAASRVVIIETAMAEPRMDKVQRRNPLLRYNKRSMEDLNTMMPVVDWAGYFENIGVGQIDTVIVSEPKYFSALNEVLTTYPVSDWKEYLKWTILNDYASVLTTEIDDANFEFYGKELRGLEQQRSREERMIDLSNNVLGEALGKLYVDAYFPQEAKDVAKSMVNNILDAFEGRIKNLEWMTPATKEKALQKLSTFTVKIGYPDKWKDYSSLIIKTKEQGGSHAENLENVSRFNFQKDLQRIGKEVDATEWYMAPQVVNAYYNPLQNEIVFPAAILQPPFYDYKADPAVNFGGIGAVIGHEISHGFDDQGSRFDAQGNMNNWWTEEDRTAFEERNQKLIAQYDAYTPFPGINVNGAFTLGENIGDLGGVNVAYDGLMRHLKDNGDPGDIDGFTQPERFFISWGTIWRTKYRDEALKTQIKTDPHSPAMYRAVGPLSNFDPFYKTFDITPGDAMYKPMEDRVKIW